MNSCHLEAGLGIAFGTILGWLMCWFLLFSSATKHCPEAVGSQCQYFGLQKICLID